MPKSDFRFPIPDSRFPISDSRSIYLVEHFFSIQGEGRYSGVPSIFLRFGGCNLKCPGFGSYEIEGETIEGCDTLRAVDKKRFGKSWQPCERATDLVTVVRHYLEPLGYRPHVVLTGGEPMLYHAHPAFYGLVGWLVREGFVVTVETNATLAPDFSRFAAYRGVTFAMAVKLSNSKEPEKRRVVPDAVARLAKEGRDSFFKFTLDRELVEGSAHEEIEKIRGGYDNEVFCMPLGETLQTLRKNAEPVALFCMKHGYRYGDRLHIRLWNDEEKR